MRCFGYKVKCYDTSNIYQSINLIFSVIIDSMTVYVNL